MAEKKAIVRVYFKNDNTYKTIPITSLTTPADVCEMFAKKVCLFILKV